MCSACLVAQSFSFSGIFPELTGKSYNTQYSPLKKNKQYCIAGSPLLTFIYQIGFQATSVSQNQIYKKNEYLSAIINGILKKMP